MTPTILRRHSMTLLGPVPSSITIVRTSLSQAAWWSLVALHHSAVVANRFQSVVPTTQKENVVGTVGTAFGKGDAMMKFEWACRRATLALLIDKAATHPIALDNRALDGVWDVAGPRAATRLG